MRAYLTIPYKNREAYLEIDCAGCAVDAFVESGETDSGRVLRDEELDEIQEKYEAEIQEAAYEAACDGYWNYGRK